MPASTIAIIAIYFGFAALELWRSNLFSKEEQTRDDGIVEAVSMVVLLAFTQPMVLFSSAALAGLVAPQYEGALAGINVFAAIGLFLILDDMMQYWWHRASHTFPWLYNLHRAHHNAKYMSVRLVYRNNLFYYAMMPGIWLSGVLIYLGLGWVYAGYIVVKLLVITGAHSDVAWDKPLYAIKWLSPVMWVVERTISTPATHHAHHGRHAEDEATHYKGNYGNLLFFWDVLFGTAKITRSYPKSYGVENLAPATLGQQLMWPVFPENKIEKPVGEGATAEVA
ncbi:sterol desaturase family protein [Qipengyuania sp. 1NDW9]|uniref:Sterol desaturase family protein n=1 Tax=Qipengyuania aquimaris TaxID=255984 RepID=A0A9Q3S3F9_9SPHN|nr:MULTISPECIES: sterol desaturase family protein [Qipengyuania]MBX7494173.1 sterol desaturase family protein [Qipengyuania xiapuensis]MBY6219287.1 sterol desaturase family protein [Qipengyuania aquimaris]UOR16328.1 sterol desaturase family protein [Qipengyuania aquimaris]